ncbi:MAG TPA: glucosidase [Acidobacteriota bacterium]|nr:glucosidase [Acidobacteriota bacterium]
MSKEHERLRQAQEHTVHWRRWGPYLSERQWGTVREDYSADGDAWAHFPHDQARSRAYRWGEDGLLGLSDNHQRLCFAVALWNGEDPILKERLFGLANGEGNHGEDVKECYYYLDNTPSHSYMKALYKYPQASYPYLRLVEENRRRGKDLPEFELIQTGVFDEDRYFDVFVEYAKAGADDIVIRITAMNLGPDDAVLHVLPTLWFRNTWDWHTGNPKPALRLEQSGGNFSIIRAEHPSLGKMWLASTGGIGALFTENETNRQRLFGIENSSPYVKDGIDSFVVHGDLRAVNPQMTGTKAAFHHRQNLAPGASCVIRLRLSNQPMGPDSLAGELDAAFAMRKHEADEFYSALAPEGMDPDARAVARQAFAGMLWNKQFYHYVVKDWLEGDPTGPPVSEKRKQGRNHAWEHLYIDDVLSMPDKWEYPWFAAWDLAFHCIPLAMIDPDFAKRQLLLLTREWYMHPNGQLPAYEWAFDDANPPVHAWAAWRVYKIEQKMHGHADQLFLERVFQKLLLNFTWWVNRKDTEGKNIFQGGFLGLDNIGIFDRSKPLPTGGHMDQSDGTSWMAMYSLNLLRIALELAQLNPSYEDIASKFFEHFLYIANAMNHLGGEGGSLWDEEDGFFYDRLHLSDGRSIPLKVRSLVGLIPILAVETLELSHLLKLPGFARRVNWFMQNRPDLSKNVTCRGELGFCDRRILSIVTPDQLRIVLRRMLDEDEFLGPYGIRALSRYHELHPYEFDVDGVRQCLQYEPGESRSSLFGGNSNWRGPVWLPLNFLMIESLQKFHHYLGDEYKVECPTGSGQWKTLWEVSLELSRRLTSIFLPDAQSRRPVFGSDSKLQHDPRWRDCLLFYEYFHGNDGLGLGAGHQTGWTGLVAKLLHQLCIYRRR